MTPSVETDEVKEARNLRSDITYCTILFKCPKKGKSIETENIQEWLMEGKAERMNSEFMGYY